MIVQFECNLKENLRILSRIYKNPRDYMSLRSVIWNPFVIIPFFLSRKKVLRDIKGNWIKHEQEVSRIFDEFKLSIQDPITCYVTSVGPEGMFDLDRNVIHARYFKSGGWYEFLDTVLHESIHIAIYDPITYSYEEEEGKVEAIMKKIKGRLSTLEM